MSDSLYDLIIIGGGISGLGLAHQASYWGFRVLLLEKNEVCQATSHNSLRIIHGGFRYLQSLNFARAKQSIKAQEELLRLYPEYIKPLPCLFALNRLGLKSALPVTGANILYSLMRRSLSQTREVVLKNNKILTSQYIDSEIPLMKGMAPYGALLWQDAIIADLKGFHNKLKQQCLDAGVVIKEGQEVIEIGQGPACYGVYVRSGQERSVLNAKTVANTTGPWLDTIGKRLQLSFKRPQQRWCRAFNIVLNKKLENVYALAAESKHQNQKKRLYFITPRENSSVIGTEYLIFNQDKDDLKVNEEEIASFLSGCNQAFPTANLSLSDIAKVELGVLPLHEDSTAEMKLLGNEKIFNSGGYVEVLSTKYTTFMPQARNVLSLLTPFLR